MLPTKGTSLQDEIKCYSLPYGGIGFLSHMLTYWAMFWLGFGRRPWMPWKHLDEGIFDLVLMTGQLLISIAIASFTIVRCQDRWQFVLIATWKLVTSVEVGIWGLRASVLALHNKKGAKYNPLDTEGIKLIWHYKEWMPYTLFTFYAAGMITGMVGLLSLVWEWRHDRQVVEISAIFFAITGAVILVCLIMLICCCFRSWKSNLKIVMGILFTGILVCALYSDWILGIIAGNLVGAPSGDQSVLYWAYFAAKRLPLAMT